MAIELKIPNVGESISEVQIAEWLKRDGETVKKDENVAVIDSEKTTLELPAPEDGKLKILHQAGEMVKVGAVVARIETNGDAGKPEKAPAAGKPEAVKAEPQAVSDFGTTRGAPADGNGAERRQRSEETKQPTVVEAEKDADEKGAAQERQRGIQPQPVIKPKIVVRPGEKVVPMTMLRRT